MTHKIKIVSLLMVSAMLFFVGCKKNNPENETNETSEEAFDEVIPEEIIQLLDNCPITNYQDINEFGFHGKSDNPLDNLFAAMCEEALFLTDSTKEYGVGVQNQKGLAYVSGFGIPESKEKAYWIARKPTWKENIQCECKEELYGTDCSGFIAHVMNAAGVGIEPNGKNVLYKMTASQQVDYFKQLTDLNISQYMMVNVKVKEFKNVKKKFIKNGDIIYKINRKGEICHIGIFLIHKTSAGNEELIMFQSSGSPKYGCQENRHENGRGPIQREVNEENLHDYFEKDGEGRLLRITPIIETNWVDLGLPSGNLWATQNVGANSPKEFGSYFAWGETEEDSYYDWNTYKYCTVTTDWYGNITNWHITKYNDNDNLTTLQLVDDAAAVHLGGRCRMPTIKDWKELLDNTTNTLDSIRYGVKGVLFKEKYIVSNGDSLFLPAAGFRHVGGIFNSGQYDGYGFYWTSSLDTLNSNNASYVRFKYKSETPVLKEYLRLFGLSIRPVRPTN